MRDQPRDDPDLKHKRIDEHDKCKEGDSNVPPTVLLRFGLRHLLALLLCRRGLVAEKIDKLDFCLLRKLVGPCWLVVDLFVVFLVVWFGLCIFLIVFACLCIVVFLAPSEPAEQSRHFGMFELLMICFA